MQAKHQRLTGAISGYDEERPLAGELQLIIGHVGAGKSLYMRRYREILVAPSLQDKIFWLFVDFNESPPSLKDAAQAQNWLCQSFVTNFEQENKQYDLNDEKMIHAIFSADISRNKAIYERLILPSTPIFDRRFAARIADRVRIENERGYIPSHMRGELLREFHSYLNEQAKTVSKVVVDFATAQNGVNYILRQIERALNFFETRDSAISSKPNELDYL